MSNLRPLLAVAVAFVVSSCRAAPPPTTRDLAALDGVTSGITDLPLTTASADARNHFLQGQRELDLGRVFEANDHFRRAVAADSTFAIAYDNVANTGNSFEEFNTNLARAEKYAAGASDAERLRIQIDRRGLENDVSGQLALAQQLVAKYPESPRAFLALATVQTALNRNVDARVSIAKAVGLAPRLLIAHTDLGNSYLNSEPKDFAKALEHFQHAEGLAPNEPYMHDLLGDAQRALNDMPRARAEYTRGHELNPRDASLLQQRGHVNTFAGDYAAARADYDSAMTLGRGNERAAYAPFRAYVSAYAGDPQSTIAELNQLVAGVDAMNMPEPRGMKINALTNVAVVAIHTRDFAAADAALKQRTPLMMEQADQVGSAAFRRAQEANVASWDGWLAARKGDYTTARRETDRMATLVAPDANPRKMEPVHQLKGFIAFYQGNFQEAAAHFAQGNLTDPYIRYHYAVALGDAGQTDRAKQLFREIAVYNFNSLGYALIRKDAQQKAS